MLLLWLDGKPAKDNLLSQICILNWVIVPRHEVLVSHLLATWGFVRTSIDMVSVLLTHALYSCMNESLDLRPTSSVFGVISRAQACSILFS